ncbi:hypothetical protein F751_2958 [Auxenochlorella protothecoides]|uniref:Uncharacterized protein n=1 Tax=Auxenochlorella protothecoides TaxID=3075 RepID=A0A087SAL3_AUXPR|nr:hypothetical protein F751_2958 [Auxenochlorella protothecoides]KFM22767.1 hypothetical protein F751_2958 [Auxenochlorella protothecoides]
MLKFKDGSRRTVTLTPKSTTTVGTWILSSTTASGTTQASYTDPSTGKTTNSVAEVIEPVMYTFTKVMTSRTLVWQEMLTPAEATTVSKITGVGMLPGGSKTPQCSAGAGSVQAETP